MAVAIGAAVSFKRVEKNRKWEDYQSLKRYWSNRGNAMAEVIFEGNQVTTGAAAEVVDGAATIAFNAADTQLYIAQEIDDANYDGKKVWIDYVDSDGILHEDVETVLDSATSTATEVPIGCLGTPYVEAISARSATGVTMTAIAGTIANQYAGWYIVACGDATHQEGNYLTVASSSVSTPVVLTTTGVPDADWADDNVSLQKELHQDVYRIRRMWTETEAAATKSFHVVDKDASNGYAVIPDTLTYGSCGSRYTALDTATYRSFLGRLQIDGGQRQTADADVKSLVATITFTPLPETGQAAADTTIAINFLDKLDWQPCIELAEASDVIVKIHSELNDVAFATLHITFTCLEITI